MSESFRISTTTTTTTTSSSPIPPNTGVGDSSAKTPALPSREDQSAQSATAPARSLAQKLDSMLLKAAQATTQAVNVSALDDAMSKAGLDSPQTDSLHRCADATAKSFNEISQFTGRQLAAALVVKKGQFVWDKSQAGKTIKKALDLQGELAGLLHKAVASPMVKGEHFEVLSEMALQAERRQMEILTLALQLADAIQQKADDPEVVKQLDAKLVELLPRQALKINGNEAALEKMKAQLQPLADRIDALASRPNASISSEELAALQHETTTARNALEHAAQEGFPTSDGGRWMPDKAFFTEAKKLVAKAEETLIDTRKAIGKASMYAFAKNAFGIPDECPVLKEENLKSIRALAPNLVQAAGYRHKMYKCALRYIDKCIGDDSAPVDQNEIRMILDELGKQEVNYDGVFSQAFEEEINRLKRNKVCSEMEKNEEAWKILRASFNKTCGMRTQIEHLKFCMNHINTQLSPEKFLSTDSIRALMEGKIAFSTIVEARIHGMEDADVNPKLDDSNMVSTGLLGHGQANTVYLVKYNDGSEYVFKSEALGRQGMEGLTLSKDYGLSEQVTQLNLATQKTAELLGVEDVMTKSSVGCHKGQYGFFMEKAPGISVNDFGNGTAPKDGGLTLRQIRSLPDEQYGKVLGEVIRQTNRLEWMDLITGQGDRHANNYMIDVRPDGTVTVKGIDNDQCFPAYRTGLRSFHLEPLEASKMRFEVGKIVDAYPADNREEIRARFKETSGVKGKLLEPADGPIDIDATKIVEGELHYALKKAVGLHGAVLPEFIDEDLFNRLKTLKRGNPDRETYLADLRKRLPLEAVASAEKRLDEAIEHAESLKRAGMVISQKDFWKKEEQRRILEHELSQRGKEFKATADGKFRLTDTPSDDYLTTFRYQTSSLFMRDLAKLTKDGWFN